MGPILRSSSTAAAHNVQAGVENKPPFSSEQMWKLVLSSKDEKLT